ncbi:tetratricopeptide repeat protein [Kineosporia sp. NBRC 101731]|uniref:ATP-binding protein n=1 Tax=Kineosporia sp. NBRC 101731 TaxID=3032199 RepID=UPI0024A2C9E9|nr:tetratricopeptide repeat protein [Kineosporia sp. NBRC 101731]GLY29879.1 ATPase [Kineosporia sp. NBRC 101731]
MFLGIGAVAGLFIAVALTMLDDEEPAEVVADHPVTDTNVPTVLRTLPTPALAFVDREQESDALIARCRQILASGLPLPVQALDGMPGVGKSTFATHVAHLLTGDFPDGQVFMNLDGYTPGRDPVNPAEALSSLLVILGVPASAIPQGVDDQATVRARSLVWRALVADQRLIIVFDNVRSYAQVEPLLPESPRSLVLVTSRRRLFELAESAQVLDVLPLTHAADLFLNLAGRDPRTLPRDRVEVVTAMCGNLPLAISLLAARFRYHPSWTIEDLIIRLTQVRDRLPHYLAGENGVSSVLDLSFDELPVSRQNFVLYLGTFAGSDLDAPIAAALAGTEMFTAVDEIESLHADHLLEETDAGRYRFHDLVRAYASARSQMHLSPTLRDMAGDRVESYYLEKANAADRWLGRVRPTPRTEQFPADPDEPRNREDALRWFERHRGNLLAVLQTGAERGNHETTVLLCSALSAFLQHAGPWDQAVKVQEIAIDSAQMIGDPIEEGRALARLGLLYRLQAKYALARGSLEKAVALLAGSAAPADESFALNHLGIVEFLASRYQQAEQCQRRALSAALTANDPLTHAGALHDLGMVLRINGKFAESAQAQSQAQSIFGELGDTYGQANALRDLGLVESARGNYAAALGNQEQALAIYRMLGDRVHQGYALNECGTVLRIRGRLTEAEAAHREALGLYEDVGDRFGEANSLRGLGILAREQGDLPAALATLRRAVEIYDDVDSSSGIGTSTRELALTEYLLGRPIEADDLFDQALQIQRDLEDRLNEAVTLNSWGRCLLEREDDRAEDIFATALELAQTLGARLEIAKSTEGLAVLHARAGHGDGRALEQCAQEYHDMGLSDRAVRAVSLAAQFTTPEDESTPERL